MKILALTSLYPRRRRELMAAFNRQQFRELAAEHELRLVAPVPWLEKLKDGLHVAEFVRILAGRRPRVTTSHEAGYIEVAYPTYFYVPRLARHRLGEWYLWSVREAVRRVARKFQPDVLLACWAHPDGWAAARLGRELDLPVVLKVIGSDLLVVPRDPRRRQRVAETLRAIDRVVAVSENLAETAVRLGAPAEKVVVVREGVDRELFSPGDQAAARERLGIVAGTLRVPSQRKVAGTLRVPSQRKVAGILRMPWQRKVAGILRMPWQRNVGDGGRAREQFHDAQQGPGGIEQGNGTRSVPATMGDDMTRDGTRSVPATMGDEKIVLFVGNVLLSKGAGVLVEAMARVQGSGFRVQGSGEGRADGIRSMPATFPRPSPGYPLAGAEGEGIRGNPSSLIAHPSSRESDPKCEPRNASEGVPYRMRNGTESAPYRIRCYLVGAGRDEGKVRRLIKRHGLEEVVRLVGPCPHEKLVDWYRACDVVALPSFSEGIPNVLQEAISCGRPFVATHVGGIPEIAHPSYSRLVPPGDPDALADALVEVLDEKGRGKGDRNLLCEAPSGPFRQKVPVPFSAAQTITWQESAARLAEVLADAVRCRVGTAHQESTETAKTLLAESES